MKKEKKRYKRIVKMKEFEHVKQRSKDSLARTWLNHAENQGVRESKGELIVFLQDYIHIKPDALEKFGYNISQNPRIFVSGVGHQYVCPLPTDLKGLIYCLREAVHTTTYTSGLARSQTEKRSHQFL